LIPWFRSTQTSSPPVSPTWVPETQVVLFLPVGEVFLEDYAAQCAQDALPMANIEQYNFAIIVDNTTIYQNATMNRNNETVRVKIPSRKIVFGFYNESFYGPYVAEVWVWQ